MFAAGHMLGWWALLIPAVAIVIAVVRDRHRKSRNRKDDQ